LIQVRNISVAFDHEQDAMAQGQNACLEVL